MDAGWRFSLGNAADPGADFGFGPGGAGSHHEIAVFDKAGIVGGPAGPNFDDGNWRRVDLPHDWAVELPFDPAADRGHGYKPVGRNFPGNSIGWYRRAFSLRRTDSARKLSVEFDGVFRDSTVWLNGHFLGRHSSGYTGFAYDISDVANYGGENVLVVRADASFFEGWFYEGAGIYRHVWLTETDPLHVAHWGTAVTSEVRPGAAVLTVRTEIVNDSARLTTVRLISRVKNDRGETVESAAAPVFELEPSERRVVAQTLPLANPRLWDLDSPYLYDLESQLEGDGTVADVCHTAFGIRTLRFDPDQGFLLNGRRVEIKGTCDHQDHAGVGAALPDRLQYFRIEKLKEMGSNAYRTSHNPPTPELLDACDRLGMLVMDENRLVNDSPEYREQLSALIRRDRNHPCVFIWSLGNEETAIQGTDLGARVAANLQALAHRLDPSRLCTIAMNGKWGQGFSSVVDVQGFNYLSAGNVDDYHRDHPRQPLIGTEVASNVATRGIYASDRARGYVAAYQERRSRPELWWDVYAGRPFLAGAFVWTGFDYRGEPTPCDWPCISSHFGAMDTCGYPKEYYYFYQAWWSGRPVIKLFPHWNWPGREGQPILVRCFSNADEVEVFLNGRSQGRKAMPRNGHLEWEVNFAPGTLLARGYRNGNAVGEDQVETAGTALAIRLVPDRRHLKADGADLAIFQVQVVDAKGRIVPTAQDEIQFQVTGGSLIGVGNGDPSSHESDRASQRHVFNGLAQLIVQAPRQAGVIAVDATGAGLKAAHETVAAEFDPGAPLRAADSAP